jgi:hypothetical protein
MDFFREVPQQKKVVMEAVAVGMVPPALRSDRSPNMLDIGPIAGELIDGFIDSVI